MWFLFNIFYYLPMFSWHVICHLEVLLYLEILRVLRVKASFKFLFYLLSSKFSWWMFEPTCVLHLREDEAKSKWTWLDSKLNFLPLTISYRYGEYFKAAGYFPFIYVHKISCHSLTGRNWNTLYKWPSWFLIYISHLKLRIAVDIVKVCTNADYTRHT